MRMRSCNRRSGFARILLANVFLFLAGTAAHAGTSGASLTLSTTTSNFNAAGQSINLNYLVTNIEQVQLTSINVVDQLVSQVNCPVQNLAVGASTTCTASYTTTQANVDSGSVSDSAYAIVTDTLNGTGQSNPSSLTVNAIQSPAISLLKSSPTTSFSSPGQTISYSYLVTNSGNETLSNVAVTDNKIASANISCPATTLAPNASTACTATYISTQADVDSGLVTNIATASAQNAQNTQVTSIPSSVTINAILNPAMSLLKSSPTNSFSAPGQTISYGYLVTNTGNDTLNSLAITDNKIASGILCPVSILAPNASTTCTAMYTVTQADVTAGLVTNIATASAQNPQGTSIKSPQSTVTVNALSSPSISLVKSTTTTSFSAPGQTIAYSYLLTNTGNASLNNLAMSDNKIASANIACLATTLAPSASTTCTGSYTVMLADVDNGAVTNIATASGQASSTTVTSAPSTVTVNAILNPSISLLKSSPTTSFSAAGQTIAYSYLVTNAGNDTLSNIAVTDNKIASANIACPATTLAPSASTTCTSSYTVTQADVDGGAVTNIATASAQNAQGTPVSSVPSTVTVNAVASPAISLTESVLPTSVSSAGDMLTYSYTVSNGGNVTLSNLAIADTQTPPSLNTSLSTIVCTSLVLAPSASTICTATYTVTAADIANGSIGNTAAASATTAQSFTVTSNTSALVVRAAASAAVTVVAVPTLAQWMLSLLVMLLGITGARLAVRPRI